MTSPTQSPVPAAPALDQTSDQAALSRILDAIDLKAPTEKVDLSEFGTFEASAKKPASERVAGALKVLMDALDAIQTPLPKIDKLTLDKLIAQYDAEISRALDNVMHHPTFQNLESSWRGLQFLVDRTNFRKNTKVEIVSASKDELRTSFEDSPDIARSGLYKRVYQYTYDTPGGEPYAAMVANYEFENSPEDMYLLRSVSQVAAAGHCPFIGGVGAKFFGKATMDEWRKIPDLSIHLQGPEFIEWNSFRDTEESRYVGLVLPRFLLRLPYGAETIPVKSFNYKETVSTRDGANYLWGNAAFAFASNMTRAFADSGWSVQIRGPEGGGKVERLPVHLYDVGQGKQAKIPTELLFDGTLELNCANHGFIALSQYDNRDYACFFSANSAQRPVEYDTPAATANARINARLPYIFLASRIGHYLKVMQRENIGSTKDRATIEEELNRWLQTLVTKMNNPSEDVIAKHPLRAASVTVSDIDGNPGYYRIAMSIMPHIQIEGMDITLSLVGKMPTGKK